MDKEKIYQVLKIICESIKDCDFEWRLDGSANLFIQGVKNAIPKDIDITTQKEGIKIFRKNLKKYLRQDFYNEKKKAHSLILNILSEEVEINHYPDWNGDDNLKPILVSWKGLKLKCLPLVDAERFYRNIGRIEAADKLKKFLSSNQ